MTLIANQTKRGQVRVVNFRIFKFEEKSVIAEKFITKFINSWLQYQKIFILINQMTYLINMTIHMKIHIKMKPVDVKSNTYIESSKENKNKDSKVKIGDIFRIWKYKKFFAKGYTPNWSEEVFVIKRKILYRGHVINDHNVEKIVRTFYKNELKKTNQEEFTNKNVIKRIAKKLYAKWKW